MKKLAEIRTIISGKPNLKLQPETYPLTRLLSRGAGK